MIIDCISDLHGELPKLPKQGDLLIIAGDVFNDGSILDQLDFDRWLSSLNYRKIVLIAGNHDNAMRDDGFENPDVEYLCDSGCEFEGFKIWGSPWSLLFPGINPKCIAFTGTREELKKHWDKIPLDTDILVTHTPPYGILDKISNGEHAGCIALADKIITLGKLKCHIFGHIHEGRGVIDHASGFKFVNASLVDRCYQQYPKAYERIIL
jgi:Icc-related predicted phosphoesterase